MSLTRFERSTKVGVETDVAALSGSARHPSQGCEPCGECAWCAERWRYRREARKARAALRLTHRLLAKLESALHPMLDPTEAHLRPLFRLIEESRKARERPRASRKQTPPDGTLHLLSVTEAAFFGGLS